MFEYEALYSLITYVGNENEPETPPLLYLKQAGGNADTARKYQARKQQYKEDTAYRNQWFGETSTVASYISKFSYQSTGRWGKTKRSALRFMLRSYEWADVFLNEQYGDIHKAYRDTKSKDKLGQDFLNWFETRRGKLRKMMKVNTSALLKPDLTDDMANIVKKGRVNSHGGVANLLKVLTKTMEKQGADIRSIAKMQYLVCSQAGIYIPDEFIEDVAVVLFGGDDTHD